MSSHTENGIEMVGRMSTSDQIEFCKPRVCTTLVSGIKISVGGTRYVAKMAMPSCSAPGRRNLASAYPAGTAVSRVMTTTPTPIISEFAIHVMKRVCCSKYSTLSSVGAALNQSGLFVSL